MDTSGREDNYNEQVYPRLHGIREEVLYNRIPDVRLYHNQNTIQFEPHWHSAVEILFPIEQNYTVRIDAEEHILVPGDILIIAPGTIHSYTPPESGERIFLLFDYDILRNLPSLRPVVASMQPYLLITQAENPPLSSILQRLLRDIVAAYDGGDPFAEAIIHARLLEFFARIGQSTLRRSSQTRRYSQDRRQDHVTRCMEVCTYIEDHLQEDLSTDQLAEIAGFSKFHFTRLFKEFTGVSTHEYLIRKRIETAENLLAKPEYSITEVAMQSGFNSLSTFTRVFKSVKGMTPTAYRKSLKDSHGSE